MRVGCFFCFNQSPSVFVSKQNQIKLKLLSRLNFKLPYVAELARNRKELSGWALNSLNFDKRIHIPLHKSPANSFHLFTFWEKYLQTMKPNLFYVE